jgi:hypothetical protein
LLAVLELIWVLSPQCRTIEACKYPAAGVYRKAHPYGVTTRTPARVAVLSAAA